MFLDTIDKTIEISLETATDVECDVVASYADHTENTFKPGSTDMTTNGLIKVVAIPAPLPGVQRQVKEVMVCNPDVGPHTVTMWLNNTGIYRQLMVKTLQAGDTMVYRPDALSGPKGSDGATGPAAGDSGTPADFGAYFRGKPDDDEEFFLMPLTRAIELPILLSGSLFVCKVAPTVDFTVNLVQNASIIGTILFAAGTFTGTPTFTTGVVLNIGDIFEIQGPTPTDVTIEDISFDFRCTFA